MHGLPWDNARRLQFDSGTGVFAEGTLAVDRVTEGVNDATEKAITDGHIDDRAGPLDDIALLDLSARFKKNQLVTVITE